MGTAERINYPAHFGVAGTALYRPLTAEHGSLLMESLMRCSAQRCRSHSNRAEIKGFAKSLLSKQAATNELIARRGFAYYAMCKAEAK